MMQMIYTFTFVWKEKIPWIVAIRLIEKYGDIIGVSN